jgi:DNA-binding NarL/FixJ family response regulator
MRNYIIADHQELTRFALEGLLRQKEENDIRRATDKAGLVELLKEHENSVVVLDYTLFDFQDEEQLLIISERFSMASWVLVSNDLTDKFLRRIVYSSPKFSVVFKDEPLKEIRDAIEYASSGKRYVSQRATELILAQKQEDEEPAVLTATETEIVKAIAQGKTTKEIAAERFSSIHTVTTHRKNIFRKLGINTAHEAVKYALRAGLIDPSEFYI